MYSTLKDRAETAFLEAIVKGWVPSVSIKPHPKSEAVKLYRVTDDYSFTPIGTGIKVMLWKGTTIAYAPEESKWSLFR